MKSISGAFWWLTGIVWLGAAAAGLAWLWQYGITAGATAEAPPDWPAGSRLPHPPGFFTLIMFVHPECPCSRASLTELEGLLTRSSGRIKPQVVFYQPEEKRAEWRETALWRRAREIPGVKVEPDGKGREAGLFLAQSSGDTFVYDQSGRLVFHGGITAVRGHTGDNAGSRAIEALVQGARAGAPARPPVYGCPLQETAAQP